MTGFRIFTPRAVNLALLSSAPSTRDTTLEFQSNYDSKQIDKILKTVNKRSEVELGSFNISKQRVRKIEMRKQKQGEFKKLEDILELDGFGVKVLEKFCDSILSNSQEGEGDEEASRTEPVEEEAVSMLLKKKQTYVTPALLEGFRQSLTSCVSIHVDLNCIAWTKLSLLPEDSETGSKIRPIQIDEWMCHLIGNDDKKRSLSDLIQILNQLNEQIPVADTYVVEAQPSAQGGKQPGNPVQVNVNVQKAQLYAMVCMLVASRSGLSTLETSEAKKRIADQQRIFFLRTYLASRLYKIYIGKERVSTEDVIKDVLRYGYEAEPTSYTLSAIKVPKHLRDFYEESDSLDREFLGQSMLIGLTFLKLCVLKCAQSVKILNKRSNSRI